MGEPFCRESTHTEPLVAAGRTSAEIGGLIATFSGQYVEHIDRALLSLFHGQRTNAGIRNVFEGFERALVEAGLHMTDAVPPAICFLDLTGYTRLTEERGDQPRRTLRAGSPASSSGPPPRMRARSSSGWAMA
jgi:hypothetical protein